MCVSEFRSDWVSEKVSMWVSEWMSDWKIKTIWKVGEFMVLQMKEWQNEGVTNKLIEAKRGLDEWVINEWIVNWVGGLISEMLSGWVS